MTYLIFVSHKEDKPKFEIMSLQNYDLDEAIVEVRKRVDHLKIVNPEYNYSAALVPVQYLYEK